MSSSQGYAESLSYFRAILKYFPQNSGPFVRSKSIRLWTWQSIWSGNRFGSAVDLIWQSIWSGSRLGPAIDLTTQRRRRLPLVSLNPLGIFTSCTRLLERERETFLTRLASHLFIVPPGTRTRLIYSLRSLASRSGSLLDVNFGDSLRLTLAYCSAQSSCNLK